MMEKVHKNKMNGVAAKAFSTALTVLCCVAACSCTVKENESIKSTTYDSKSFGQDGYVRSATYFGEAWPMNFWNSELETLDADFKQISADGFDSIVILVPWKEFQPGVSPIEYNDYPFDNLRKVMETAEANDLGVYVRVGYVWDFYNDSNEYVVERFIDLFRLEDTRTAWMDYCGKLYDTLDDYPNFKEGFLTWEDLWLFLVPCGTEDETVRIEYAKSMGYQEWVESEYGIDQYNKSFKCDYASCDDIPVPKRDERAMAAYFDYYDYSQNKLLSETQEVFPNLSLEVRLDADGINTADGKVIACTHEETYSCESSDFTAAMYGIPMGFDNHGQKVSAAEAMKHTEYMLKNLAQNNDGKPVYIDQFLYMDNAPAFSYNAQLEDDEMGMYLESVSDIMREYTAGYAVWAYRDYRTNMLYNPQFALGDAQWILSGNPVISKNDTYGTWSCRLSSGDAISQIIPSTRNHYAQDEYRLIFDVIENDGAVMEISMGNAVTTVEITEIGRCEVTFPANESLDITISATSGEVEIDNLYLYTFIQDGRLYDADNNEMELAGSIRVLNGKLAE